MYLASFAGYFPADNPKYSVIVTVNNPRGGAYYGGLVAGPVFKEIAERVFAAKNLYEEVAEEAESSDDPVLPGIKSGRTENIIQVAQALKLSNITGKPETALASVKAVDNQLVLADLNIQAGKVPDVRGMGASDAIFILESAGLKVNIQGMGKVIEQSLRPNTTFTRGASVHLTLG
jgi:cell division protein FtsI (penicillin-binding protein 3)